MKKIRRINLFIFMAVIIFYFLLFSKFSTGEIVLYSSADQKDYGTVGGINPGNRVIQNIKMKQGFAIDKISLQFATYKRKNTSTLAMKVLLNNQLIKESTINAAILSDNGFFDIPISVSGKENDIITIEVSSLDAGGDDCVTMYVKESEQDGLITCDDTNNISTPISGVLSMKLSQKMNVIDILRHKYGSGHYYFAKIGILLIFVLLTNLTYRLILLELKQNN